MVRVGGNASLLLSCREGKSGVADRSVCRQKGQWAVSLCVWSNVNCLLTGFYAAMISTMTTVTAATYTGNMR